jgi:hypothetical protein
VFPGKEKTMIKTCLLTVSVEYDDEKTFPDQVAIVLNDMIGYGCFVGGRGDTRSMIAHGDMRFGKPKASTLDDRPMGHVVPRCPTCKSHIATCKCGITTPGD